MNLVTELNKPLETARLGASRTAIGEGGQLSRDSRVKRTSYISPGTRLERHAPHLLSRGSTFVREPLEGPPLKISWRRPVPLEDREWFSLCGPIALSDGSICQGTRSGLYRLDLTTGSVLWHASPDARIDCVAACGNLLLAGGRDGLLRAVAVTDGVERWRFAAGDWISSISVDGPDTVLFSSRDGYVRRASLLDGSLCWESYLGARVLATPTSTGDSVFVGSRTGEFFRLSTESGCPLAILETGSDIHASANLLPELVVVGSDDKRLYAADLETLEVKWMFRTGDAIWCRPIAFGDRLFVASTDSHVYCLDPATGDVIWNRCVGAPVRQGLASNGDQLCVADESGQVALLAAESGKLLGVSRLEGSVWAAPAVVPGGFVIADRHHVTRISNA